MHEKLPTKTVRDDGWVEWKLDGKFHRLDGPAKISPDGAEFWYRNGRLHRDDGPSVIYPDGSEFWFRYGQRHRNDGPAVIYADGRRQWCRDGSTPPIVRIHPNVLIFQYFDSAFDFSIRDYPSLTEQDDGSYTVDKEDLALIMLKYNKDIWTP